MISNDGHNKKLGCDHKMQLTAGGMKTKSGIGSIWYGLTIQFIWHKVSPVACINFYRF